MSVDSYGEVKSVTLPSAAKKRPSRAGRVVLGVLGALVVIVVAVIAGFNVYLRLSCGEFFANAEAKFQTPGINSGFIPQDLDCMEGSDGSAQWVFSGYTEDGTPSPLVKLTSGGKAAFVYVQNPDGSSYMGHGSAITSYGAYAFLSTDEGYLVLSCDDVVRAQDGEHVRALDFVPLDFSPAFLNIEAGALYAGVFYYAGPYDTPEKMHVTTPDGTRNYAVMYAYPLDDGAPYGVASNVACVYSIPDQAQGMCLTDGGLMVFSTSWGVSLSHLKAYDLEELAIDGVYGVDGEEVPLVCLDGRNLSFDVAAPPMTEGIEWRDGCVWISNESASNKYIFGKLCGGATVYAFKPFELSVVE